MTAALELFVEQGFAATRIDEIARRAGVSKGTVYLYFASKEALLEAVVRDSTGPLLARAAALLAMPAESNEQVMRALTEIWIDAFEARGVTGLPKLIYAEAMNFPDIARIYLAQADQARSVFEQLIRRGILAGEFVEVDVEATARAFLGGVIFQMVYRHALAPLEAGDGFDMQRGVRASVDVMLRGLKA